MARGYADKKASTGVSAFYTRTRKHFFAKPYSAHVQISPRAPLGALCYTGPVRRFRRGDPCPEDLQSVFTVSGRWNRRGGDLWQHEQADTDMGDVTWDELLDIFGACYAVP